MYHYTANWGCVYGRSVQSQCVQAWALMQALIFLKVFKRMHTDKTVYFQSVSTLPSYTSECLYVTYKAHRNIAWHHTQELKDLKVNQLLMKIMSILFSRNIGDLPASRLNHLFWFGFRIHYVTLFRRLLLHLKDETVTRINIKPSVRVKKVKTKAEKVQGSFLLFHTLFSIDVSHINVQNCSFEAS